MNRFFLTESATYLTAKIILVSHLKAMILSCANAQLVFVNCLSKGDCLSVYELKKRILEDVYCFSLRKRLFN